MLSAAVKQHGAKNWKVPSITEGYGFSAEPACTAHCSVCYWSKSHSVPATMGEGVGTKFEKGHTRIVNAVSCLHHPCCRVIGQEKRIPF